MPRNGRGRSPISIVDYAGCCRGTSPTSALAVTPNAWPRCFIKHAGSGASGYRVARGRAMSLGRSSRRWWPCTHCHRLVLSTATSDREPTGTMKNRMRELRSFGSVRGEGSDVLAYSENRPKPVIGRRAELSPKRPLQPRHAHSSRMHAASRARHRLMGERVLVDLAVFHDHDEVLG